MRRQIPDLHSRQADDHNLLEGRLLIRVDHVLLHWRHRRPVLEIRFVISESKAFSSTGPDAIVMREM